MTQALLQVASTIVTLSRWQAVSPKERGRVEELRADARRCFRLALGTAGRGLAAELEAIGRDFDREANCLSARMQAAAYQICYSGLARPTVAKTLILDQLNCARLV